jgi:hypothetical protein
MKKAFFLFIAVILFSCSKGSDSVPQITGDWDMTFIASPTSGTTTYTGLLSIVQSGSNITGTLDWGGTVRPLLTNSTINTSVSIYCENLLFNGSVNASNDFMGGDLYNFDYFEGLYSKYGTWKATKK